ncbi:hypothetical protein B0I35DRAFT_44015 [Stachybotrys elegans]|uniref:DUF4484 domain-containing protein n=1 Tax=Stachybotrys elegans TaxID=80388 RepID=A0A8K0WYZ3_9HYPO|nr:hypothetical protein B0I35DRAFT_44015 [Stachybotrys elegans]
MAASRPKDLHFSALPSTVPPSDLPPISALFLIDFDVKAGYTIVWKQAEPDLDLDGAVEYKSLPSGLHTVTDDLIYFVHAGTHAGLSAFVNEPCEEEEARHARMIAVGILVPLSYGRLGRAWRHAEALKSLASKLAKDRKQTALLQQYWDQHKAPQEGSAAAATLHPPTGETPLSSPSITFSVPAKGAKTHTRNRSASDGAALSSTANQRLSPYHPAWSLSSLLDKFGPLIFPIYRAALLRKRILISCHAPVREICDFVYDISILSNIPLAVSDVLPSTGPTQRLRPLFTIGVHDIGFLMEDFEASKRRGESAADDDYGSGWIACTTDSILAMKDTLWDMLITMPPEHSTNAREKVWPVVEFPRGHPVKATQRDLRRFHSLREGLARLAASTLPENIGSEPPRTPNSMALSTRRSSHIVTNAGIEDNVDKLIEPLSWTALAYNGFMWWASAGEQMRSDEQEESARDAALLADVAPAPQTPMSVRQATTSSFEPMVDSLASLANRRAAGSQEASLELAIIAYFHRLTAQTLTVLADVVSSAEDERYSDEADDDLDEDTGADGDVLLRNNSLEDDAPISVDSRSVENMGLDVWSASDAVFIQELMRAYYGREAHIEGKGVEVCGVRVC